MRTYDELGADITRLGREAGNVHAWTQSYAPGRTDELNRLAEQQKQISGALDVCYAEKNLLDILNRERELKDFLQKQEQQVKELQQKEAFQKADDAERERQSKELAAKQERDKQELLQKQERDKQENEKQELLRKQEMQALEAQLKEMLQKEKELADANARKQENVVSEIAKETAYAAAQAADAVREALHEIRLIREAETRVFLEEQKQQLASYIHSDSFQRETAERKEILVSDKFYEQQRAEKEKFDGRPDDFGYRAQMQKDLEALHDSIYLAVKREQELEKLAEQQREELRRSEEQTRERIENSGLEKAKIEEGLQKLAAAVAAAEKIIQEEKERAIQAAYEKALEEQRQREIAAAAAARSAPDFF